MLNNFRSTLKIITSSVPAKSYRLMPLRQLSIAGLNRINTFSFCSKELSIKDTHQTFELLVQRLKDKVDYCQQLERSLLQQNSSYGTRNKEQIRIQITQLAPIRTIYEQITSHQKNIKQIEQMMAQTKDPSEVKILAEEVESSKEQLTALKDEVWDLLIPKPKYDNASDVIMQVRPGAGGSQSCIFVKDISDMYHSYCANQGWKCWITSSTKETGVSAGYKALDMRIQGEGVQKMLKSEAGVHKVIRVPETQSKGRLHSSTISVVVMPVVPFAFELDPKDIKYQFTRSSGPGGQAVNKIESACRATHIPTGLQVFIQEERSQDMNKKRATDLLRQKIFEIEYRKTVQEQQSKRKSQVTTLDRSEKIRTYNYPQDRITDHRTGLTKFGIIAMMNGELLDEFYQAYNEKIQQEKIIAFVKELYEEAGIPIPKK